MRPLQQLRVGPEIVPGYWEFVNRIGRSTIIALLAIILLHIESFVKVIGGEQASSGCHMRELELCAIGTASIFQNPNGLPANLAELKRQCEFFDESASCFEDYGQRCLTDQQSMLVNMFRTSPLELSREFCLNGSATNTKYLKYVACFREIQHDHQRKCLLDLQTGLESIHKLNSSLRLPTICCNINRMKECIFPKIEEKCGEEALEFSMNLMELSFSSMASNLCRNYDPFNENCTNLMPKIGTKPHNGRNTSAISRIISGYTNVQPNSL